MNTDKLLEMSFEAKDPYEQCIQYASIESGIKAHAEEYSFNIESELFNQLTKEQQKLWRKEIEQACISGGEMGVELAKDLRYKENLKVKEVDLENTMDETKDEAMRDIAWKVHVMISKGKSVSEIDHYVCGICDF